MDRITSLPTVNDYPVFNGPSTSYNQPFERMHNQFPNEYTRSPIYNQYTPPPMYNHPPQFYPHYSMYSGYPYQQAMAPPHNISSPRQPYQTPVHHNSNPFYAVLQTGNISKCASCSKNFSKEQQVVVIKHVEKDIFVKEGETRTSSEKPHYYHAIWNAFC